MTFARASSLGIRNAGNGIHQAIEAESDSFDTHLRFQSGDQIPLDCEGNLPPEHATCCIVVSQADTHLACIGKLGCASQWRLLAGGSQHIIGRKNSDVAESAKILGIERQQIRNSVHPHGCHHACIMDLDTRDARRNHDSAPLLMCCFAIGGKRKLAFDQSCTFIRLCNRVSEPVPISRSSADVPEFSQILRCVEEARSLCPKTIRTLPDRSIFGAIGLYKAEQNVRVQQVGGAGHQACSP